MPVKTYFFRCRDCGSEDTGDKEDVQEFRREHPDHNIVLVSDDEDE